MIQNLQIKAIYLIAFDFSEQTKLQEEYANKTNQNYLNIKTL